MSCEQVQLIPGLLGPENHWQGSVSLQRLSWVRDCLANGFSQIRVLWASKKGVMDRRLRVVPGPARKIRIGKVVLWRRDVFKNIQCFKNLETLEILESVQNKGESKYFLEILENLELVEIPEIPTV